MDINDEFSLEHLLFTTRTCRNCGEEKDLLTDFYKIRKDRGALPSSYSYECKQCTICRVMNSRKNFSIKNKYEFDYPDW
jgi:hypothetical protein